MVTRVVWAVLGAITLAGCSSTPTEIFVVVDTDLAVPAQVDTLRLDVTGPDGMTKTATSELSSGAMLPRTTTLEHDMGPLGPFVVHAIGLQGTTVVVDRSARVSFVAGRILVLRMDLLGRCVGAICTGDTTCAEAGCRPVDVATGELASWTGMQPSHLDAGPPAGDGGCSTTPEICNGIDDNCNGRIDETTDLASDPSNCGSCGHVCAVVAHSTPSCVLGTCRVTCDTHYADCNGAYGDGCETSLETVSDCGGCALACMVAHATPSCSTGDCTLASCEPGWDTCDRVAGTPDVNGCETSVSSNPARCGSCTNPCPSPAHAGPVCNDSTCGIVCDSGWTNCNGRVDDGCEAQLSDAATCGDCSTSCTGARPYCAGSATTGYSCTATCAPPFTLCGMSCIDTTQNAQNCHGCGMACPAPAHGASICVASTCGIACDPGYGDCNTMPGDGCETPLVTVTDCGSCGTPCAPANATGICGDGTCAIGSCDPGWADCDGRADDGCEVHVATDVSHCGTCSTVCPAAPTNASPVCGASGCGITCVPGFGDCDGDPTNGCERDITTLTDCGACGVGCAATYLCQPDPAMGTASCVSSCGGTGDPTHMLCGATCTDVTSDASNCGRCDNACPMEAHSMPTCVAMTCGLACDPGFGDCDTMPSTGCETDVTSSPMHCGTCATACPMHAHATRTCASSTCGYTCSANFADCTTADGCETMLGTSTNCLRCGDACPAAGAHVSGGSACTAAGCMLNCQSGFWDCDGDLANGCEVHAVGAPNKCAACGTACTPGTQVCCGSTCVAGTSCP